ncbi:hypothetical protein BJ965_003116 [Streptomyces luteogriseus]|uniref:Uncharacterized protein n=1 Tax=Streptomyces luteogriseus TaxID=68233 RepID=A0A7W7DNF9_9ACTN|nr:hypothetical protein [Streptomyces luteogriseus]
MHDDARHTTRFTVIGNHLAQHAELSLLAIGLSVHIQSLPAGARIDIKSLAARFPEGTTRIAAALRELETHGHLRRTRERRISHRSPCTARPPSWPTASQPSCHPHRPSPHPRRHHGPPGTPSRPATAATAHSAHRRPAIAATVDHVSWRPPDAGEAPIVLPPMQKRP